MLIGKVNNGELADKILGVLKHNYKLQGRWVRNGDEISIFIDGKWDENGKWHKLEGSEQIPDIETLKAEAETFEPPQPEEE